MEDRLDILVFGATGFTGKCTLPQVHKLAKTDGRSLTWGVAGRSKAKLQDLLNETTEKIGVKNLDSVPIVIADITNLQSIKDMTARAKVLINCCGPYEFYGQIVIQCCIETGTHYVDVTGESLFMERMEAQYFNEAAEKGVYIVNACGFDSIPADLGVVFLENNFQGCLNSVNVYLHGYEEGGWSPGPSINIGTWETAVYATGNFLKLQAFRKGLKIKPLPVSKPKPFRFPIQKVNLDGKGDKWAVPFPASDQDVMQRSQRYFYTSYGKPPVQASSFGTVDSFINLLKLIFYVTIIAILSQFSFGRNWLLKYPQLFSNGFFSTEPPSEAKMNRIHFSFTFYGEGWSEKLPEGEVEYKVPPNKAIVGQVRGTNPGYGLTCVALTLCAIMLITEKEKLPPKGGVYTPAAAFSKTSLVQQLQKNGAAFEILSVRDIPK